MLRIAQLLTALVAASHLGFLILEMFLWTHPIGLKVFAQTPEAAATSAVLAMNQGLYNGLLAAGLIWGLASGKRDVQLFFLGCVAVAGVFGAFTADFGIFFIQALPAIIALAFHSMAIRKNA